MIVWPDSASVWTRNVGPRCASFGEREAQLLLVGLGLRLDRHRDHRLGKSIRSSVIGLSQVAERVAGRDVLEADGRGDVAGADFLDLLALVRVHLQQPADALVLVA